MHRETPTVPERAAPDRLDDHPVNGRLRSDPPGGASSHSTDPVIEAFSRQLAERFREIAAQASDENGRSSGSAGRFRLPGPSWWSDRPRMLASGLSFCLGVGLAAAGFLYFTDLRSSPPAPTAQAAAFVPELVQPANAAASPPAPPARQPGPPASPVVANSTAPIQSGAAAAGREPTPIPAAPVQKTAVVEALAAGAIKELQELLQGLGLDPGPIDGVAGPMTTAAITKFEERAGLPPSGTPSRQLLERLKKEPAPRTASNAP